MTKPSKKPQEVEIRPDAWKRFEGAVDAALHTSPVHQTGKDASPLKNGDCFLVIDGNVRVAHVIGRGHGSITADVFRNLDDYRAGRAMERAAIFAV